MRIIRFRIFNKKIKSYIDIHSSAIMIDELNNLDDNLIVEQFTGLHDKNGKEIYEGDINQYGYVIKYCEEKALFGEYGTRNGIDYDILMSYPIYSKSQIIKGNIYENQELLENKLAD